MDNIKELAKKAFETGYLFAKQGYTLGESLSTYDTLVLSKLCDHSDTIEVGDSEHSVTACSACETIL